MAKPRNLEADRRLVESSTRTKSLSEHAIHSLKLAEALLGACDEIKMLREALKTLRLEAKNLWDDFGDKSDWPALREAGEVLRG